MGSKPFATSHIHCIVPAAGFTITGKWKKIGHSGNYLYPVHQISESFKGRLLDSLKRALRKRKELSVFSEQIQKKLQNKVGGVLRAVAGRVSTRGEISWAIHSSCSYYQSTYPQYCQW
ncbi:MAG: transposase [Saprospiraceae bacterium]|nr:transposase [Saprospiraceae bacterium]